PEDARVLVEALAQASEIATALPSVDFYQRGKPSVAGLIAAAMRRKADEKDLPAAFIYTAENHNHAAEVLESACEKELGDGGHSEPGHSAQFLNTVIGKMSGIVCDPDQIGTDRLRCVTDGLPR